MTEQATSPSGPVGAEPLLELRNVEATYGPYRALFGVSFTVPQGSAVALVGSNGAGKSTVARVISGLVRASAGSVRFDGHDITRGRHGASPVPASPTPRRAGLCSPRSPWRRTCSWPPGPPAAVVGPARRSTGRFGAFGQLAERRHQLAGTLSGGEQRMLSLAKVLAVPQRLLMVDELSLGLAPQAVDEVFDALRAIRDTGTSLLVVEQHLDRALSIADRAVVLVRGQVAAEGSLSEVQSAITQLLPAHPSTLGTASAPTQQPLGTPLCPEVE